MSDPTAVIANYGTADYTLRAVDALVADGVPPERIVVVENGSADESLERLREALAGGVVLLPLDENVGFARASNIGARRLPGDSYLFVNSDAFVHRPGSVAELLRALDDPCLSIAVPRLLNEDITLQPKVVPLSSPSVALVRASGLSRFVPNRWQPAWSTHWDHSHSREIQAATSAVFLVRGDLWDALGGFEVSHLMYADDLDLCWRARRLGWKVWFVADAEFVHVGASATAKDWGNLDRAERAALRGSLRGYSRRRGPGARRCRDTAPAARRGSRRAWRDRSSSGHSGAPGGLASSR